MPAFEHRPKLWLVLGFLMICREVLGRACVVMNRCLAWARTIDRLDRRLVLASGSVGLSVCLFVLVAFRAMLGGVLVFLGVRGLVVNRNVVMLWMAVAVL